jgi:hypothetical protein
MRNKRFTFDANRVRRGYRGSRTVSIVRGRTGSARAAVRRSERSRTAAMTEDQSPLELIRANADFVIAEAREQLGEDIDYDEAGVRWLDGFIQRRHDSGAADDDTAGLVNTFGSYLGECIVRSYNGRWQETEHGWAVIVDGDLAVFPFNKVHKHLTEGAADSVLSLYKGVPALIAHTAAEAGGNTAASDVPKSIVGKLGSLFRRR